jgi:hypothetical protein
LAASVIRLCWPHVCEARSAPHAGKLEDPLVLGLGELHQCGDAI